MNSEIVATIVGMSKMNWEVLPVCIRSPLRSSVMSSACGSPTSSGVTRNGPSGVEPAQFLPGSHWCVRYW